MWSSPWAVAMPARSIRASAMRIGSSRTRPASRSRSSAGSATTSTPASSSSWASLSRPAPNPGTSPTRGGVTMRLLVIGGSDAGIAAALRARELDPSVEATVVVADAFPNFSICGLPYYLSGDVPDWRELAHRTTSDLEAAGLQLLLDHTAHVIDPAAKLVIVTSQHSERQLGYDRLVIGTGAVPVRPPIEGLDLPGVHVLHTMADTFALHQALTADDDRRVGAGGEGPDGHADRRPGTGPAAGRGAGPPRRPGRQRRHCQGHPPCRWRPDRGRRARLQC